MGGAGARRGVGVRHGRAILHKKFGNLGPMILPLSLLIAAVAAAQPADKGYVVRVDSDAVWLDSPPGWSRPRPRLRDLHRGRGAQAPRHRRQPRPRPERGRRRRGQRRRRQVLDGRDRLAHRRGQGRPARALYGVRPRPCTPSPKPRPRRGSPSRIRRPRRAPRSLRNQRDDVATPTRSRSLSSSSPPRTSSACTRTR